MLARISYRLRTSLFFAGFFAAAYSSEAQTREFLYLPPVRPLWPTDENQCKALDAEWEVIRKDIDQRHSACLASQSKSRRPESGKACSFLACEPYHGASSLGRSDVESCRETVRKHKADLRKKEEERRAAEEEARRADEEARRLAQERKDKLEAAQAATEKRREDEAARRQREKQDREKRQKDDARTMELAQEARRAEQEMLNARNRERDERTAKLEEERNTAAERIDEAASGMASRIASAAGAVRDAIAGIGSSPAAGQQRGESDFDIPDQNADSGPESFFADIGGILVPWSGINFNIIKNAADATSDLSNEISRVFSDFENADPARLEAAFAAFPQRVFGLRPILTAVAENAVSTALTEYAVKAISPALDAVRVRQRLASAHSTSDTNDPGYSWFTDKLAAQPRVMRDEGGIPQLFSRDGSSVAYDPVRKRVQYDAAELEAIVARSDATTRSSEPRTWVRRDAVFLPSVEEANEAPYEELVKEWVVGYWVGRAVSAVAEKLPPNQPGRSRK